MSSGTATLEGASGEFGARIGRLNEIEARFDPEQLDPFFERLRAALIREVNEKVLHFKQTVL